MKREEMQQLAAQKFLTPDGSIVDILYGVSDGRLFFSPEEAEEAATQTGGRVIPFYKDNEVRELAKSSKALGEIITATDFLKLLKVSKIPFKYEDYLSFCTRHKHNPIPKGVFEFIGSKVFASQRPVKPGQPDKIFMWEYGIVDAIFLRRFAEGQVWQVGDNLVLTCPTNTELMSGTYQMIFQPLLGKVKKG